jgi:DNA-binding transcriptional regulator GbsR (MarR family)
MDRTVGVFVDGIGAAAATSGVLNQLQGRIFALLYLQPEPLSLEDIAAELEQSKSNVSINVRGLVDWHLVRLVRVPGSRKDHYEAATDFWRVMQEIMERRFRWNMRQVLSTVAETRRIATEAPARGTKAAPRQTAAFIAQRLDGMRLFFSVLDAALAAFGQGQAIAPEQLMKNVVALPQRRA